MFVRHNDSNPSNASSEGDSAAPPASNQSSHPWVRGRPQTEQGDEPKALSKSLAEAKELEGDGLRLLAMASNLIAMTSNLIAMASNLIDPNSDGLHLRVDSANLRLEGFLLPTRLQGPAQEDWSRAETVMQQCRAFFSWGGPAAAEDIYSYNIYIYGKQYIYIFLLNINDQLFRFPDLPIL